MLPLNSYNKRPRDDSPHYSSTYSSPEPNYPSPHSYHVAPTSTPSGGSSASAFRNVSACNRCRLRKNKCDQKLPACTSCQKANVKCVGIDPITKREIPRVYVYYLENRVSYLEELLKNNGLSFAPPEDFDVGAPKQDKSTKQEPPHEQKTTKDIKKEDEEEKIDKVLKQVKDVSVHGTTDSKFLGSTSGISFARVVFAAVRSSVSGSRGSVSMGRSSGGRMYGPPAVAGTTMRDSFFGLQSKPRYKQAPFPSKDLGIHLANQYFDYANPQTPILHRDEFMALLDRTYATDENKRSSRELYMLNIVFAIGAGVIYGEDRAPTGRKLNVSTTPPVKRQKLASEQQQPEEYHAAAMVHLEYFLSATPTSEKPEGFGGSLEELQAVLLLASFALLRPVAPGLWYIIGVAVRLAIDLGLHYEDGSGLDDCVVGTELARGQDVVIAAAGASPNHIEPKEKGRRQWIRDLRRRLWWCVYSFDRLVSTCVGRPLGVTDQVITTEFPSVLEDRFITTAGFTAPANSEDAPSYKRVAHHFFRYRLLQSEILQVLQHRQAKETRLRKKNLDKYMHTDMKSPFLDRFENYFEWRRDIDDRLWRWFETAPTKDELAVRWNPLVFELNYWQAIIMLYRQSLTAPMEFNDTNHTDDGSNDGRHHSDEDTEIFMKVATAGQKVLKIYFQLHKEHVVAYTFLSTHHLFMAGIAFLYAIWHSKAVRHCLTVEDVDYTVLAATTVLSSLTEKCPPADTCREAFERMARATVNMVLRTSGFSIRPPLLDVVPDPKRARTGSVDARASIGSLSQFESKPGQQAFISTSSGERVPAYRASAGRFQLDPNIGRELFPEDTPETQRFRTVKWEQAKPKPSTNKNGVQVATQPVQHRHTPMHSPASPALSVETDPVVPQIQTSPLANRTVHQTTVSNASTIGTPNSYSTYTIDNNTPTTPMASLLPQHHLLNPVQQNTNQFHDPFNHNATADPAYHHPPTNMHPQQWTDLEFLFSHSNPSTQSYLHPSTAGVGGGAYMATSGLSLGYDTDHDWNDGAPPDLLDGYWFRHGWGMGAEPMPLGNGTLSGPEGLDALAPVVSGNEVGMGFMQGWQMGQPMSQPQEHGQGQQGWDNGGGSGGHGQGQYQS